MVARNWRLLTAVTIAFAVGVLISGGGLLSRAEAQSEGQTTGVICVVGAPFAQVAPIVIVDVPDQTMLVYKFDYRSNRVELTAARTYKFDKLLQDYNTQGASVEEVRRATTQQ